MLSPLVRATAFISTWLGSVVRQPAMLITMILGPFLILALFALADATQLEPADAIVVRPADNAAAGQIPTEALGTYFNVVGETADREWAEDQLREQTVDAVIVLPTDPSERIAQGESATILVLTNEIDPITLSFLQVDLRAQVADLNTEVQQRSLERARADVEETDRHLDAALARLDAVEANAENPSRLRAETRAFDAELSPTLDRTPAITALIRASALLLPPEAAASVTDEATAAEQTAVEARATLALLRAEAESPQPDPNRVRELSARLRGQLLALKAHLAVTRELPTGTLVRPFEGRLEQVAPYRPTLVTFYAPAALALLLQHFAVTLAALSMVRARLLGMIEFWRVAPVRPGEIVAGNYLSYGLLSLLAWAGLTVAVVYGLGVPILGDVNALTGAAVLLILASLGIGFAISLLSGNEQQAAQLAMLVLLASVFLSGFVRPLEAIDYPVRFLSYLLPATSGILLFQDVMLRGLSPTWWQLAALAALALAGLYITLALFRRELRPT